MMSASSREEKMMNNQKFGEIIAKARKDKGMTQKDLAERLRITDKAISKWERGKGYPEITLLPALSKA
jgi:transcriptional regulator with XRE-family HTH domain